MLAATSSKVVLAGVTLHLVLSNLLLIFDAGVALGAPKKQKRNQPRTLSEEVADALSALNADDDSETNTGSDDSCSTEAPEECTEQPVLDNNDQIQRPTAVDPIDGREVPLGYEFERKKDILAELTDLQHLSEESQSDSSGSTSSESSSGDDIPIWRSQIQTLGQSAVPETPIGSESDDKRVLECGLHLSSVTNMRHSATKFGPSNSPLAAVPEQDSFPGSHGRSKFFKSKPCKYYKPGDKNSCRKGTDCNFAHNDEPKIKSTVSEFQGYQAPSADPVLTGKRPNRASRSGLTTFQSSKDEPISSETTTFLGPKKLKLLVPESTGHKVVVKNTFVTVESAKDSAEEGPGGGIMPRRSQSCPIETRYPKFRFES